MFTIGTIIQHKTSGLRAVIGVSGDARWLVTGEPIFNKVDPADWLECEVSVKPTPVNDPAFVRINSDAGTPNRVIVVDRGGCFS